MTGKNSSNEISVNKNNWNIKNIKATKINHSAAVLPVNSISEFKKQQPLKFLPLILSFEIPILTKDCSFFVQGAGWPAKY